MDADLEKLSEYAVQLTLDISEIGEEKAKTFLRDPPEDCPASIIYTATRAAYGIGFLDWEPETIWLTMAKDGIDLSNELRNKLEAAITLQTNLAFYWDNLVFQNTVQALNDVPFNYKNLQEPDVVHMCWAVYEASIIRKQDPDNGKVPDFDEDVQMFVAVVLKRAGYVYAPKELEFAQDFLDRQYPRGETVLKDKVKTKWQTLDKKALQDKKFLEEPLDIQLAKLSSCALFLEERSKVLALLIWDLQN